MKSGEMERKTNTKTVTSMNKSDLTGMIWTSVWSRYVLWCPRCRAYYVVNAQPYRYTRKSQDWLDQTKCWLTCWRQAVWWLTHPNTEFQPFSQGPVFLTLGIQPHLKSSALPSSPTPNQMREAYADLPPLVRAMAQGGHGGNRSPLCPLRKWF